MVKKKRQLQVGMNAKGIHKIEGFIEEICDDFNIFNSYFGNIMMTVLEACESAFVVIDKEKEVEIEFHSEKNKLVFTISGKEDVYIKKEEINRIIDDKNLNIENESNSMMIMKMLADELELDEKNNSVSIVFYISSINYNTSIHREKSLAEYFEKVKSKIKTHE